MAEQLTEALIRRLSAQTGGRSSCWTRRCQGWACASTSPAPSRSFSTTACAGDSIATCSARSEHGRSTQPAARAHPRVDVDKGIDPFGKHGSAAPQWTLADAWTRYERDYSPSWRHERRRPADHVARLILPKLGQARGRDRVRRCGAPASRHRGPVPGKPHLRDAAPGAEPLHQVGLDRAQPGQGLEVNRETPRNNT